MNVYKMISKRLFILLTASALMFAGCRKEPVSATDPLPLPADMETGKDLTVKPGDSFYDYCNGSWLKATPIPATGAVGGIYEQTDAMKQRVEELKSKAPDIARFYELKDAPSGQPELTEAFVQTLSARFPTPATREEAFITIGKMIAEGCPMWGNPLMPVWCLVWKDGRLFGAILPDVTSGLQPPPTSPTEWDPSRFVHLSETKADRSSAESLIIQGMGQDPSLFVTDPNWAPYWEQIDKLSLEELLDCIQQGWAEYQKFGMAELKEETRIASTFSNAYTLSYHFAQHFLTPEFKEKYLGITREIQASLRNRIQNVEWMSETTKANALEKLDFCSLNVAYPDQWYMDCVTKLTDCKTLAEAVYRGNRDIALLKSHLIGGTDVFSYFLTQSLLSNSGLTPCDLTLPNAMYSPAYNCVLIYPALLLPPTMPENVSLAYEYAMFTIIGHEFTHGFDNSGSQYDKFGNKDNWWTIADRMSFEDRRDLLVRCYDHLQIDPARAPGVYSDGDGTQAENIADLGGFLTAMDAYKRHLDADGYTGETFNEQLRKFYECYAYMWRVQYSDAKFATFPKKDVHSHARLRVNGVVMNTDLWYELYDVDRNSILYLPPELRTHIW